MQNNKEAGIQEKEAVSGHGKPRVMRAGGEAKANRQVLRANGSNLDTGLQDEGPRVMRAGGEASSNPHVLRANGDSKEMAGLLAKAGQQVKDGAEDAISAASRVMGDGMDVKEVLNEWSNFAGRAYQNNIRAMAQLKGCFTIFHLLQWQSNLLTATVTDLAETNARVLQLDLRKG